MFYLMSLHNNYRRKHYIQIGFETFTSECWKTIWNSFINRNAVTEHLLLVMIRFVSQNREATIQLLDKK